MRRYAKQTGEALGQSSSKAFNSVDRKELQGAS
jgi:hypothetical protein